jgi:hypothetical protein
MTRTSLFMVSFLVAMSAGSAMARAEEEAESACAPATETTVECFALIVPEEVSPSYGTGEKGGFSPADLRSAYKLPATGGVGQTIAIVDAYDDPNAESDLKTYRSHYGLSECTTANGCFQKVNQKGEAKNYPSTNTGWGVEISLDLDMASAICPECHILLVEASSASIGNLGTAENEAASLGATEISDSFGSPEFPSSWVSLDSDYNHPGIPILVAAGDLGGGTPTNFPADVPTVISVGGTALYTAANSRKWRETVWSGSGGGCSLAQPKPEWQISTGCSTRISNDVAAVASTETPVSIYDSFGSEGWMLEAGTSVSAPIMAGVEALSSPAARALGAKAFYQAGPAGELFDVTEGRNGTCSVCEAKAGYDAPTGWGTPNGVLASAPEATTKPASSITPKKATLTGAVNPNGAEATYQFEYGTTNKYGSKVPVSPKSIGSGTSLVEISEGVESLNPETTYHFRIVVTNVKGTTVGSDQTFTTPSWEILSTLNPKGASNSYLYDVSCESSASACTSVGKSNSSGVDSPIAQRWNGSSWSEQTPAKKSGSAQNSLVGVDCPSETRCIAVGNYQNAGGGPTTLGELWNEGKWSVQTTPVPAEATSSELVAVGCSSTANCRAAGSAVIKGVKTAIVEKWISPTWTLETVPIPEGATSSELDGVDCIWSNFCVAVGRYTTSGGSTKSLVLFWNEKWSLQSVTDPEGAVQSTLLDVACTRTPNRCTAVGGWKNSENHQFTMAYRFNGVTTWTLQSTPNPASSTASVFQEVSCATETSCTAVGSWVGGSNQTLAEKWNGSSWSIQGTSNPSGAGFSAFFGVSCQENSCHGVGYSTNGSGAATTLGEIRE